MDGAQMNVQADAPVAQTKEKKGISGSTIKIIAVIAMLIDHLGAVVVARQMVADGFLEAADSQYPLVLENWILDNAVLFFGYDAMRMIGRLGFPIFCFLLVEGYQRSRDVRKYMLRLGIFALISEIPFDYAISGKPFQFGYQNVYFTLLLGLFALCVYNHFAKYVRPEKKDGNEPEKLPPALWTVFRVTGVLFPAAYYTTVSLRDTSMEHNVDSILTIFTVMSIITVVCLYIYRWKRGVQRVRVASLDITVLIPIMYLADLLCIDYGGMGVLTITVMYIFRKNKVKSMLAGCIVLTIMSISEIPAFFALIPIALYNGKRGLKMKYFFYVFYPAHLLLLYLIAVALGLQEMAAF